MAFVPLLVLVALNKKLTDFAKDLLPNTGIPNKLVQLISCAIGIGLAFAFANSTFASKIDVLDGMTLAQVNGWGLVLYGLATHGGAGVLNDAIERRNPDAAPDRP